MSNTKKLSIYKSGYELTKLVSSSVRHFTRDMRPTLGRMIQEEAIKLVVNVYKANAARDKVSHIEGILEGAQVVEMLLQLSQDMRLITPANYAKSAEITTSIKKQATGWKKYSENNRIQTNSWASK